MSGHLAVMTWEKGGKLHIISSPVEMIEPQNSNIGNTAYRIDNRLFPLQHVSAFYNVSFDRTVEKRQILGTNVTSLRLGFKRDRTF
jgi:hypothetical protein